MAISFSGIKPRRDSSGERFEHLYRVELSLQACTHLRRFLKSWHPNACRLLFATRNGTPWDQNLLLKRKFRPLFRALGIHVPRGDGFHAFRHANATRSEEHTSELQSLAYLVCRLLLEKKKQF